MRRPGVLKLRAFLFRANVIVLPLCDDRICSSVVITRDSPENLQKMGFKHLFWKII